MIKNKFPYKVFFISIALLAVTMQGYYFVQGYGLIRIKTYFSCITQSREEQLSRLMREYYKLVSFIKTTAPEDSLVILPPPPAPPGPGVRIDKFYLMRHTGLCDYFIFPRLTAREKNTGRIKSHPGPVYRVKMKDVGYSGGYIREDALNKDFSLLLLKEGKKESRRDIKDFTEIKTDLFNIILALFKLLLIFGSGVYIVAKYFAERSRIGFLATSFLTGTIISTVLYIMLNLLRINFTEALQFIFLGVLSVPGIILVTRDKVSIKKYFKANHLYGTSAVIVISLFFILLFLKSIFSHIMIWDGCAIWGAKAKAIFAFHNLNILGFCGWGIGPGYPPLLPILMSQMAIGGERMVKLIFPLFALCLYANIYDEIQETRFPSILKIVLPILIFGSAIFFEHSLIAYADLALAVFVTKSVTILSGLRKGYTNKSWLALSIVLCGVVLVRPDGQAYFFYVALLAFLWIYFKAGGFKNLLYLLIPLNSTLLWAVYYKFIIRGPEYSLFFGIEYFRKFFTLKGIVQAFNWLNLRMVSINFVKSVINPRFWGVIVILFILLCLFRGRHLIKKHPLEFLFILMGCTGLLLFFYFMTPYWGITVLLRSGFPRYFMALVPMIFIIVLKEIDGIADRNNLF